MQKPIDSVNYGLRTWIEIDVAAIEHNYRIFRTVAGTGCKIMAIAKSNAYGHSLIDYAQTVQSLGVDWIGVDSIVEALKLRKNGITLPLLVLGYTLPERIGEAAQHNISIAISNFEGLNSLSDCTNELNIHLKFDTGMHRQGFMPEDTEAVITRLSSLPHVHVEGIFTHFANAKNPASPEDTLRQIDVFNAIIRLFAQRGYQPLQHAAATAGTLIFPQAHYDMVRIGIGLMGLWPASETQAAFEDQFQLQPAMTWKTIISEIKMVKQGERVGYGFTELLQRDTKLAILPVGYWHGYRWALSKVGHVIVNDTRARVCGRVCMDMTIIDVTDVENVNVGDEVILLGKSPSHEVSAEELASLAGSYNYEIITQINPLIKKIYTRHDNGV